MKLRPEQLLYELNDLLSRGEKRDLSVYEVLPLEVDFERLAQNRVDPFIAAYLPADLLKKMSWDKTTKLILVIEKDGLKIKKVEAEDFELKYVPFDDI